MRVNFNIFIIFDKYGKYTGTDPYISRSRAAGLGTPTHQLVKLDDGNYNKKNSYWTSYSIIAEIKKLNEADQVKFENNIKKIYQEYCQLSELYQKNKDKNFGSSSQRTKRAIT